MIYFLIVLLFVFGLILGSFFGVILYRFGQQDQSWLRGRSCCDHCGRPIPWHDNIPLLSYVLLKGKARCCGQTIERLYPVLELASGVFTAGCGWILFSFYQLTWVQFCFWLMTLLVMYLILLFDWLYMIIPDELVIVLLVMAGVYQTSTLLSAQSSWAELVNTSLVLIVVEVIFIGLWLITNKKGFGLGDVKLAAPLILLMGFPGAIVGVFLAFIIGSVWGILLILLKKKRLKQKVPFAPFLIIGSWLALLVGESLWTWYWQTLLF